MIRIAQIIGLEQLIGKYEIKNIIFTYSIMRTLELFSGTGSVYKVAKKYGEVVSVDITTKFGHTPTHLVDILKWDYKIYPPGHFDFIWASPPCASFSCMLHIVKSNEEIEELMKKVGIPLLNKTREIINYFNPTFYCIENPDSGRMKRFITDLDYKRASYCQYGFTYRKNTRFWTNIEWNNPKICKCKGKHKAVVGGSRNLTKTNPKYAKYARPGVSKLTERYSIPQKLIEDIIKSFTSIIKTN